MWPWEHVLFAYLLYSPYRRLRSRAPPTGPAVIALVVGSLLPDVVDKPLAWQFGIAPSGYGPAHSIFVAVPITVVVYLLARRVGRGRLGAAFGFGYLLHLVGDVIPISVRLGEVHYDHLLWPLVRSEHVHGHATFGDAFWYHLDQYLAELVTMDPSTMIIVQIGLAIGGLAMWLIDGCPGIAISFGALSQRLREAPRRE